MFKKFYVKCIYPYKWRDAALSFILMSVTMPFIFFGYFAEEFDNPANELIIPLYLIVIFLIIIAYYMILRTIRQKRKHRLQWIAFQYSTKEDIK